MCCLYYRHCLLVSAELVTVPIAHITIASNSYTFASLHNMYKVRHDMSSY